jgi:hypothetical protein
MKDFLEFNENEATIYPNIRNTMNAILRGNLIALSAATKKNLERTYTNSLTVYLRALEKKEANLPIRSRQKEIIKLRAEINQVETKELQKESTKPRSWGFFVCLFVCFLRKST